MARRWNLAEEKYYRTQLKELYIAQNKTIDEIGLILHISPGAVFNRLRRLDIETHPEKKANYLNRRSDVTIPTAYSDDLAEFFGIMLGDGHLSHFQVTVTLGTKEKAYADYIATLMGKLFGPIGTISTHRNEYRNVYIGSTLATKWLKSEGLVFNKVKSQVDAPAWVFEKDSYMERFVRGFFDTDGSVYKLKFGIQISFTNYSKPLLASLQRMLIALGYRVSKISGCRFYITKIPDVERFFKEIAPSNPKHVDRFKTFLTAIDDSKHR